MKAVRKRFGPGCVLTGSGRRACDGVEVELDLQEVDGQLVAVEARLLEVHDINAAERRAEREVAWFLKRCTTMMATEGLTLFDKENVFYIPPDKVVIKKVRYQQFCTPPMQWGPFSTGR